MYLLHGGELSLLELAGAGLVAGQVDVDHHHAPLDLLEGVVADEFLKCKTKMKQMIRDEITKFRARWHNRITPVNACDVVSDILSLPTLGTTPTIFSYDD